MNARHWTRRDWLRRHVSAAVPLLSLGAVRPRWRLSLPLAVRQRHAVQSLPWDAPTWQALAQQAVAAAITAGATYADARLTRTVRHVYALPLEDRTELVREDFEEVGVGVRALVRGYWGFAAAPYLLPEDVVSIARDAVDQAQENAKGTPRVVELGNVPAVTGTWQTPIRIDPFSVTLEEKLDEIHYWHHLGQTFNAPLDSIRSWLTCVRQERVLATSEGSLIAQTTYETGGEIYFRIPKLTQAGNKVEGIDMAGAGWEVFEDANIPKQIMSVNAENIPGRSLTVGRYTLLCDGATMCRLLRSTLGVATQLDRALGYEANANGTSFLDQPLAMIGHEQVTSPLVTLTANRSAARQLATVQWDEEGVVPETAPLITAGVLTDFQTTREQAAWLAPYYQAHGRPIRSHGYAAAADALSITMQRMPNLALAPNPAAVQLDDLVHDLQDGLLVQDGEVTVDSQARNGELVSNRIREVKKGKLGRRVTGGAAFLFNTHDLWQHLTAIGGLTTQATVGRSPYAKSGYRWTEADLWKGEPLQGTSYTTQAPAATLHNIPCFDQMRKA